MAPPSLRLGSGVAWLGVTAAVLALVPVLLVPIPGFTDAPAHMARHHILAVAPFGGPLSRHFVVHWQWIANLGEDIPAVLLGRWLGGEAATRIVSAAIAPLTVAGMVALSRAAHGRVAASALLAAPLALHQAWMFGFLNYCLGTALALLAGAWLFTRQRETLGGQVMLALVGVAVWTAHLVSWGILLILAAGNELGALRGWRDLLPALRRNAPLLLPVIPLLLWRSHASGSDFVFVYDNFVANKLAIFAGALRGTWMSLDLLLVRGIIFGAILALLWAGRRKAERRLLTAGVLLAAVAIAVPEYLLNSWGTDLRTAPVALTLIVLAIPPARDPMRERVVALLGLSLFLVRLGSVTWTWSQRSPVLEERLQMLDAVPRGGRLGYLFVPADCDGWRLEPDEKLASYAVPRREAFVNTLFMVDNARLVTVRDPHLQARWTSDSQRIDRACPGDRPDRQALARSLAEMRHDGFDAIWVSGMAPSGLPSVPGYAVARSLPDQTMLVRRID